MILQASDIERTILSTLLQCDMTQEPERIARFRVDPGYFSHPVHKSVAKAVVKLQEHNNPPLDAFVQELLQIATKDELTQNAYLDILAAHPMSLYNNLASYYNILKRRQSQRLLKVLK